MQAYSDLKICKVYHTKIQKSKVDVGAERTYTVLEICKVYHAKIHKIKGGRWRYKLTVSFKLAKSTIQRYKKKTRVDVADTNLRCA